MSAPMIQIKDLSISFSGNKILKRVSLDIGEGEYVSIIGPNGAGKTTLIKCMAGIYSNWEGSIQIAGLPYKKLNSRNRARLQSYVPQAEGRTNPLTVEEFVATGRYPHLSAFTSMKKDDYTAVERALEKAGLIEFRKRKIATLSGGERQMAFIAAALAQETKILLLDEPSTFLDYRHQAKVTALLESACRENGITVIAVHHDINTAAQCSHRIHAIKEGSIIFSGTPKEATHTETLKRIYDTNFVSAPSPHSPLPLVFTGRGE